MFNSSYKDKKTLVVVHSRITETNQLYQVDELERGHTSLRRLVDAMLDTKKISRPLTTRSSYEY